MYSTTLRLQIPRHRRDADSRHPRGPADGRGAGGHLRQPHHRRRLEHRQGVQVVLISTTMIAKNDGFRSYQMTNVRLVDDC